MRRYVGQRKRAMGFIRQETFVPQSHAWVRRRRLTGTKRSRSWMASVRSFRCFACGAGAVDFDNVKRTHQTGF